MRFLQTEWHRHERDRNAWEIERAEMKSRIGRLEGDVRTNKRLRESLAKHVRLLEAALKKEREKVKKLTNNEEVDDMRDPKEIARESLSAVKCTISLESHAACCASANGYFVAAQHPRLSNHPFGVDPDETQLEYRQENERDKSRLYLSKCSQEVSYRTAAQRHWARGANQSTVEKNGDACRDSRQEALRRNLRKRLTVIGIHANNAIESQLLPRSHGHRLEKWHPVRRSRGS